MYEGSAGCSGLGRPRGGQGGCTGQVQGRNSSWELTARRMRAPRAQVLNVEQPGGMSYVVSGPDHMLADLAALKK